MATKRRWIIEEIVLEEGDPSSLPDPAAVNFVLTHGVNAMRHNPRVISIKGIKLHPDSETPQNPDGRKWLRGSVDDSGRCDLAEVGVRRSVSSINIGPFAPKPHPCPYRSDFPRTLNT